MDLGFHIADLTWTGGPPALAPILGRLARDAEAAGIARLTVMDHFRSIGRRLVAQYANACNIFAVAS